MMDGAEKCPLCQASWNVLTLSATIGVEFLSVAHHSAKYAACALRGLYLLTRTAGSGEEIERWIRLPDLSEHGTSPYSHLPTVADFSLFSFSRAVPSQYWHDATLPPTMRGIICGVPQPADSGWAAFFSCR